MSFYEVYLDLVNVWFYYFRELTETGWGKCASLKIFYCSAEASLTEVMVCVQVTAKFGLLGLFVAHVASLMLECTFMAVCESYILT